MNADPIPTCHYLIIRNGLQVVQTVELADKNLTVGRSFDCDISLNHHSVSRQHACMEIHADGWYVIDAGSVNGVIVNGRRIQETRLAPGDIIEIRPFAMNYMGGDTGGDDSIKLAEPRTARTITRDFRSAGIAVKQRLEDLYTLSRLVIRRKDDGAFWTDVHATLQRSLAADRCVLVAVNEETGFYRLAPQARPSDAKTPLGISRTVINQAISAGQGMLIQHVASDERFADAVSLIGSQVGSVMCVPLLVEGSPRAIFYADRQTTNAPFAEEDLDFVITAVDLASAAVALDELQGRARELSRVRGRIDAARDMQKLLLPSPVPQPNWGQVAAINHPADQISGDIYDVLVDSEGRLIICIADVSGKGVPAAFAAAILLSAFRNCLDHMQDLDQMVQHMNKTFDAQSPPGCFATCVICRWSASGDSAEIVNAGH
ncbi:MAG: FHA domain-containing protein, partial [Planctomycetota bacterium]